MDAICKLNEAAAQAGDIELLLQLLRCNPLILRTAASSSVPGANPLEIACLSGNRGFVEEFLNHDGKVVVRQLNQDGSSPLHIAAAIGDVEFVKEFLKVDLGLCLLRGREARIPLHLAAIKGHVLVVKELLRARGDSIETRTSRGETALHLAVKNYQFDVLCTLVEHMIEGANKVDLLNRKDERGNTILHLAAAKKQHEVVHLVLKGMPAETISKVEVNSLNEIGYTALDLLQLLPSEAGDREIEDIMRAAGGLRAIDIDPRLHANNQIQIIYSQSNHEPETSLIFFQYDAERDSPGKVRDVLLVIVTLITTATFQAGLSPPTFQKHREGGSISLASLASAVLSYLFMFFNTSAFFLCLYTIHILTKGFPLIWSLRICIFMLSLTYLTSTFCRQQSAPDLWGVAVLLSGVLALPCFAEYFCQLEDHEDI